MTALTGQQRKKLRGMAHHLAPAVMVGQGGLSASVVKAADQALTTHELIKVKFLDFKDDRKDLSDKLATDIGAEVVGAIGHILILFRQNDDAEDQKIEI